MSISDSGKKIRLNGKEPDSINEIVGFLRPVLFSPEEVNLLKGGPAGRRSLLDRAIFQTDPSFLGRARDYNRCLLQRNRLLRDGFGCEEMRPWTESLIRTGARLRYDRHRFLQTLGPLFREIFSSISGGCDGGEIVYPAGGDDEGTLQEALRRELGRCEKNEYRLRQTLAGPHRDELNFLVEGKPVRLFGSQGQQRTAMLAFKTAQVLTLERLTGESPLLLLDDMTSELDRRRQGYFFRFLMERPGQVFITTTDLEILTREGIREGRFFRVAAGELEEIHP